MSSQPPDCVCTRSRSFQKPNYIQFLLHMLVANINQPLLPLVAGSTTNFRTAENLPIVSKSFTTLRQALDKIKVVMFFRKHFHSFTLVVLSLNKIKRFDQGTYEERMLKARHQDRPEEKYSFSETTYIPKEVKNAVYLPLIHHQIWLDFD